MELGHLAFSVGRAPAPLSGRPAHLAASAGCRRDGARRGRPAAPQIATRVEIFTGTLPPGETDLRAVDGVDFTVMKGETLPDGTNWEGSPARIVTGE